MNRSLHQAYDSINVVISETVLTWLSVHQSLVSFIYTLGVSLIPN